VPHSVNEFSQKTAAMLMHTCTTEKGCCKDLINSRKGKCEMMGDLLVDLLSTDIKLGLFFNSSAFTGRHWRYIRDNLNRSFYRKRYNIRQSQAVFDNNIFDLLFNRFQFDHSGGGII